MRTFSVLLTCLVLAACGAASDDGVTSETSAASAATTAATSTTVPATTAAPAVALTTGPSPFGDIVVDGEGYTLYLLLTDRQSAPTCVDECEGVWAPHRADALDTLGPGIDPTMVGTVAREDGVLQTTYNGWPLYRYRDDGAPGDLNGHGQLNVFYALGPHGGTVGVTE